MHDPILVAGLLEVVALTCGQFVSTYLGVSTVQLADTEATSIVGLRSILSQDLRSVPSCIHLHPVQCLDLRVAPSIRQALFFNTSGLKLTSVHLLV